MQLHRPIPEKVATWIGQNARTATEKNHLNRLVAYMVGKFIADGVPFDEQLDISREHFRNQVGSHYLTHLQQLERAGVVHIDHTYKPGQRSETGERLTLGQCKRYQFAPEYVFTEPQIVTYTETRRAQFDSDFVTRQTVKQLARIRLSLRQSQILPYLRQLVTAEYIRERCKVNDEIEPGNYRLAGVNKPFPLHFLRDLASRNRCDLIVYREKAFLADLSDFLEKRRVSVTTAYFRSLVKLKGIRSRNNVECKRNTTNYRLDTNLTNLKSDLLRFVKIDGEHLVGFDLANSQPLLLAHLMQAAAEPQNTLRKFINCLLECEPKIVRSLNKEVGSQIYSYQHSIKGTSPLNVTQFLGKTAKNSLLNGCLSDSCIAFQNSTKNGKFYNEVARAGIWDQTLNTKEDDIDNARREAKTAMFVALFASDRTNPPAKQALASLYPGIVHFTDAYKRNVRNELMSHGVHENIARKAGKRSLAVTLQTIESQIFIDGILARLLSEGFAVFSKHDSILCKASDRGKVRQILREELDSYLGPNGYRLKEEHHGPTV